MKAIFFRDFPGLLSVFVTDAFGTDIFQRAILYRKEGCLSDMISV